MGTKDITGSEHGSVSKQIKSEWMFSGSREGWKFDTIGPELSRQERQPGVSEGVLTCSPETL